MAHHSVSTRPPSYVNNNNGTQATHPTSGKITSKIHNTPHYFDRVCVCVLLVACLVSCFHVELDCQRWSTPDPFHKHILLLYTVTKRLILTGSTLVPSYATLLARNAAAASDKSAADVTEVYKAVPYKKIHTNHLHGSYHWDFERLLSVSMIPLFAASAMQGAHPITDSLLGVVVPLHCHVGFDAMITDYLHPGRVGNLGNKACTWTLRGVTLLALYGCYQFNTTDIGLTELVKKAWTA